MYGAVDVGAALTSMTAVSRRLQNTVDGFIEPHVNRLSLENNTVLLVFFVRAEILKSSAASCAPYSMLTGID